jgi:hypothetical protein
MGYLLDTCIVSNFVKGEQNTLTKTKTKSKYILPSEILISSFEEFSLAKPPQY